MAGQLNLFNSFAGLYRCLILTLVTNFQIFAVNFVKMRKAHKTNFGNLDRISGEIRRYMYELSYYELSYYDLSYYLH